MREPLLVWLHVIGDSAIALAYFSIPLVLGWFIRHRKDLPYRWIFGLFAAFITLCGCTHLMEVWTLWHPHYWVSGFLKLSTALVSLLTAVMLTKLIPQAMRLRSPEELEVLNRQLSDRNKLIDSAFEYAATGMVLVALDGRFFRVNPSFCNLLGYSQSEILGKTFQQITYTEDLEADLAHVKDLTEGKSRSYQMEKRYYCKDGSIIWVEIAVSLVRGDEGEPLYYVAQIQNIGDRQQQKEKLESLIAERTAQLQYQAYHDALTGLFNRIAFEQKVNEAIAIATETEQHSLLYLDLDRFKLVNDTCGHAAGDELLRQISRRLSNCLRQTDVLARLGGDEFGVLLYDCCARDAEAIAHCILSSFNKFKYACNGRTFDVGVSIGICEIDGSIKLFDEILNCADSACYVSKNEGRNRAHTYTKDDTAIAANKNDVHWIAKIKDAIECDRFQLYYQPIVSACDRQPIIYEILLRLIDDGAVVLPGVFLPAAERYGLMPAIDRWTITKFFSFLAVQSAFPQPFGLPPALYALNLSGASVNDTEFVDYIKAQLNLYQIPPNLICFELTETIAIANFSQAAKFIAELKAIGCAFALDDFGSGMSSFSYLKYLRAGFLKIDGAFVRDIIDDPFDYIIVEAVNSVAQAGGLKTIAEFVETAEILDRVRSLGVDYVQGYAIAYPQPLLPPIEGQ